MTDGLQAKLIEKDSKTAQIEIEGQVLKISADYLPANINPGENIRLYFLGADQANLQEKKIAKAILEEILNGK